MIDEKKIIANGVMEKDGKPLEAFLHPVDDYNGLKAKYLVFKADTGANVENCFVLRPDKDHAAVEALRAYANATENEDLAEDIYNWVGKGVTIQKWIPVEERLPKNLSYVLATYESDDGYSAVDVMVRIGEQFYYPEDAIYFKKKKSIKVFAWMPLPEPYNPKKEGVKDEA